MTDRRLVTQFIDYFADRNHVLVPSSPLVPKDDPTLLFTSAGMVQFKPLFAGVVQLPYRRAVSCQKCFRLTDVENVGRTMRHLTFFEMLGNFSFGDYFKEQAIAFAWEFIAELGIDVNRLWATIFQDDDESARLWESYLPAGRIVRLGAKDNFWGPAGKTGACGPCSEIYYDMGEKFGCGKSTCAPGCDCDRYLEFWNLVFPQFFKNDKGELEPLKNRGIDTGMGVERLTMIVEGAEGLFESSVFRGLRTAAHEVFEGRELDPMVEKVLADHSRALCFLLAEGVNPSNEGRGYAVRRLLRRASLMAYRAGQTTPFLSRMVGPVVDKYGEQYPELKNRSNHIATVLAAEEEGFARTLAAGLGRLRDELETAIKTRRPISGEAVFQLHDTYGFPPELTAELAEAEGVTWDQSGYEREMEGQRTRSRAGSTLGKLSATHFDEQLGTAPEGVFLGYDADAAEVVVKGLFSPEGEQLTELAGNRGWVALVPTPFYAEAGGQVADQGELIWMHGQVRVLDVRKTPGGWYLHLVEVLEGSLHTEMSVWAKVDLIRRRAIERNHTATHLIHRALRMVLGPEAVQAGSLVAPDRLRFDFHFNRKLTPEELAAVEERANADVLSDIPIHWELLPIAEARERGAMALFGEKYGDTVRVVTLAEETSDEIRCVELCGGLHVRRTGEIGQIVILGEEAIAAGTRRIEAVSGTSARDYNLTLKALLEKTAEALDTTPALLPERASKILAETSDLKRKLAEMERKLLSGDTPATGDREELVGDIKVLIRRRDGVSRDALRELVDELRNNHEKTAILAGSRVDDGSMALILATSKDIAERVNAGKLLGMMLSEVGGKGGGRADFAQGGVANVDAWDKLIAALLTKIG